MVFEQIIRERGTAAAVLAIKPLFDALRRYRGDLTSDALRTPYVLAFLTTMISFTAKIVLGKDIRGTDHGYVVLAAWAQITGDSGVGVGQRIFELATSHDPMFNEGATNAVKIVRLMHGKPDLHDADVTAAIEVGSLTEVVALSSVSVGR